jgi:tRNA-splicing ligase RtcB
MPATLIKGDRVPIRLWANPHEVDSLAMRQLKAVSSLPWVAHHVAVMPDVHVGKGATVGSVIALRDAVAPAAVGVDIGCGMAAVKTSLFAEDLPDGLKELRHSIERVIPVGRGAHRSPAWETGAPALAERARCCPALPAWRRACKHSAAEPFFSSAAWVAGTTSSRCVWIRQAACG